MRSKLTQDESFWYLIPDGVGKLEFPSHILEYFASYQQKNTRDMEAGGQLFWEYSPEGHRRVSVVTGPRPSDQRSRTHYKADQHQEQIEIDRHYKQGHYFLGDWHTHPEAVPCPSGSDIDVIREIYKTSKNPGPGLLLVIVGTNSLCTGLSVSWCNREIVKIPRL